MEQSQSILNGYGDQEKGAYLGAIASIATADRKASEDELQYLSALARAANLSEDQEASVIRAATELSADELKRCLEILKNSELKYSLVADLITFAKVDENYTDDEKSNVEKIVQYLQVNQQQFSLLDQFVNKTTERQPSPEEVTKPSFIDSLGFREKFQNAGININSLSRGLLSIVGPMVLAKMVTGGMRGRRTTGSPFNMNRLPVPSGGRGFGGLGSLFSILNGGRSYRGMGNLLPGLFR
jgi:hypothetical protein